MVRSAKPLGEQPGIVVHLRPGIFPLYRGFNSTRGGSMYRGDESPGFISGGLVRTISNHVVCKPYRREHTDDSKAQGLGFSRQQPTVPPREAYGQREGSNLLSSPTHDGTNRREGTEEGVTSCSMSIEVSPLRTMRAKWTNRKIPMKGTKERNNAFVRCQTNPSHTTQHTNPATVGFRVRSGPLVLPRVPRLGQKVRCDKQPSKDSLWTVRGKLRLPVLPDTREGPSSGEDIDASPKVRWSSQLDHHRSANQRGAMARHSVVPSRLPPSGQGTLGTYGQPKVLGFRGSLREALPPFFGSTQDLPILLEQSQAVSSCAYDGMESRRGCIYSKPSKMRYQGAALCGVIDHGYQTEVSHIRDYSHV